MRSNDPSIDTYTLVRPSFLVDNPVFAELAICDSPATASISRLVIIGPMRSPRLRILLLFLGRWIVRIVVFLESSDLNDEFEADSSR